MIKLESKWSETSASFFRHSLETNNRRLRERFLALALIASGRSVKQVAEQVGRRRQTVAEWVERYNAKGIDGLKPSFKSKAATTLSKIEFEILEKALGESPLQHGILSEKWRSRDVAAYVKDKFGKEIHPETARRYTHQLNGKKSKRSFEDS